MWHKNWIGVGVSKDVKDFDSMYHGDEGPSAGFDRKDYPTLRAPAQFQDSEAGYKMIAYLDDAHDYLAEIVVRLESL